MVNPGHPSRGCHACRQMKVKCDEQKPACGRCLRSRRECPGYDRSKEHQFRSMNTSSAAKVQSRVRRRLGADGGGSSIPIRAASAEPAPPNSQQIPSSSPGDLVNFNTTVEPFYNASLMPAPDVDIDFLFQDNFDEEMSSQSPPNMDPALGLDYSQVQPMPIRAHSAGPRVREQSLQPTSRFSPGPAQLATLFPSAAPRKPSNSMLSSTLLSTDWTSQAVVLFFQDFTEGPDSQNSTFGSFSFLPYMYSNRMGKQLTEAVQATALASLAIDSGVDQFGKMARKHYSLALLELGKAMNNRRTAISDETLAATSALALYEIITGEQPYAEVFHAHFHGQSTILRMRGKKLVCNPWTRSLVGQTNRTLLYRDLAFGRKSSYSVKDWPADLYASPLAENSARLTLRAANLCSEGRILLEVISSEQDENWFRRLSELVYDAVELDQEMAAFLSNAPESAQPWSVPMQFATPPPIRLDSLWQGTNMSSTVQGYALAEASGAAFGSYGPPRQLPPAGESPTYPSRIDIYPTPQIATLLVGVECVRTHLIRTMFDVAIQRAQHPMLDCFVDFPAPELLYSRMCDTIENVCAAMPYVLGDVDENGNLSRRTNKKLNGTSAMFSLWALHKLCCIPGLDPGLRHWLINLLDRIGRTGGLRKADVIGQLHRRKWET